MIQESKSLKKDRSLWSWIPSLYFTQGLPYIIVMSVSVAMYKNFGLSNSDIAFYTSLLNLPWVFKPLWSPLVELYKSKRWWIISMQLLIGAAFGILAYFIPQDNFVALTLSVLALVAFSSATHDIAADGMYILALSEDQQSFFVGIRSTFYKIAMLAGQGGLVFVAGYLADNNGGDFFKAWIFTFIGVALFLIFAAAYHFYSLPIVETENTKEKNILSGFYDTISSYFKRKDIIKILSFLLVYRLGEAQLVKLAQPFMLDNNMEGGLGLSNQEVGVFYGTIGVLSLTLGGILGGILVSRGGLKKWMLPMLLAINLPNSVYLLLAIFKPTSYWLIGTGVAIEQFGYGFGFTAYMMYMIYISSKGKYKTAHFAFSTGFMAAGMMLPGMFSGMIQEALGYTNFFIWVLLSMIPALLLYKHLNIDENFGRK